MIKKTRGIALAIATVAAFLSSTSNADIIYDVSDTSVVNCTNAQHGLWTNSSTSGGSCSNYYSMQDGSTLTIFNNDADSSNWYAVLEATAKNPQDVVATINITFSNFAETHTLKAEGGNGAYNGNPAAFDSADIASQANDDIDFFRDIVGTISFSPDTNVNTATNPAQITGMAGGYAFQFGLGANAKKADEFGASAWITGNGLGSGHWDLNLKLNAVPEPMPLLLLSLGLIGLGASKRRKEA